MSKRLQKLREKWTEARLLSLKGVPSETAPDIIFDAVVSADPTPNHKYVDWCLKSWSRGTFQWEDIRSGSGSRVADQLLRFEINKHKVSDPAMRSLMKYRGPGELDAVMDAAGVSRTMSDFDMSSNQQKKMFMLKARLESIHHETESGLKFDIPLTEFASNILGRNTRWCTAASNDNRFYEYAETGPLFIFTLPTGERFQGHVPTVVDESWETPEEERSPNGIRKAVVLSVLKSPSSYGVAEACDEITIMNENDTVITTEDYKKIDGYLDEILGIMLQATAKAESIEMDPNVIKRISREFRAIHKGIEPPNEERQQGEEIVSMELKTSLPKEDKVFVEKVSRIVDECVSAIKPKLEEAGYINETTALDLEAFIGGFKRTSNPGFTLVRDYVERELPILSNKYGLSGMPEYKKESIVFNTIKKTLGGLKFKEGFIEELNTSRHNYLFDLNVYKTILRENIEDVIDRFPKEWGTTYLFRVVNDTLQHTGEDDAKKLINKLRENTNPIQITLNRMICLDIQAGQGKGSSYINDFIANFDENYKKFDVKDKAAAISSAIEYYLSNAILKGVPRKNNIVKDIDLSSCDFKKEDVISLLELVNYVSDRSNNDKYNYCNDYIRLVMDYYNKKGISLNANDIMGFDRPDTNRKHQIQAALMVGGYNKEIKPGHPLYFLSEMSKGSAAYLSYTSSFLFSQSAEQREILRRHTVTIPHQEREDAIVKAQLSSMVFVPNQKVLEAIHRGGINATQDVKDYIVTKLRRNGNDIGLIKRDATIGPLLIKQVNKKIDDLEKKHQATDMKPVLF